jgi:hypothetical protein
MIGLSKSVAPSIPELYCPGCLNLMKIKTIETLPKGTIELTYRCEHCAVDTKRIVKQGK